MRLQESTGHLTGVAERLMITLYARASETQQPEAILCDRHSSHSLINLDMYQPSVDKSPDCTAQRFA
jgi:O-methyltransferase involved in polyketide biosynthesis